MSDFFNPDEQLAACSSAATMADKPVAASTLLLHVKETLGPDENVVLGDLLRLFGVRGFAFLILALAMLNMAIFMVPGLSLLFGLPMLFLTVQMVMRRPAPLLPAFLTSRAIKKAFLIVGIEKAVDVLTEVEPYLRPRFVWLCGPQADRVHSVLAVVLSCMIALPLPFLNLPPSLAIAVLSLGLLQRDGLFILIAYVLAGWSLWLFGSLGHAVHGIFF